MSKRLWAFALSVLLLFSCAAPACAATLGPAASYEELQDLLASADNGDTILISGEISAQSEAPLSTQTSVHILSSDGAVIDGLRLENASVTLSGVTLDHSLAVSGTSHVHLGKNVSIKGSSGSSGVSFSGNGTLIIEPGCRIEGGEGASGVSINHRGGEFYSSIEGSVRGGSGTSGGTGIVISPLQSNGAVMITGSVQGGSGDGLGGHALNLYDLSGNAYVTVDGVLKGGDGIIGGDGIQLVSAGDVVNVGINGRIKGGSGKSYGGNALILMNAEDSSSFRFSGRFSGGDAASENAQPGTSLQLVGDSASLRAFIGDCILEDGKPFKPVITPEPAAAILPVITPPAVDPAEMITLEPIQESVSETVIGSQSNAAPEPDSPSNNQTEAESAGSPSADLIPDASDTPAADSETSSGSNEAVQTDYSAALPSEPVLVM